MKNVIEVKNLTKEYKGFKLDNISFNLPVGSIMGFIGENGAGKTTTIKSLLDIIKYEGSIKLLNKENKNEALKDIGVVLDDAFFPEILNALDINSIMKGIYSNWDSKLFFQYLIDFKIPKNKPIKNLSKGMHKKLEIAVALSHHPKLLILDEPTTGLDPVARSEIIEIFQNFVVDPDCSIFISSHITSDLEHIADYIVFINEGKIILNEKCSTLLEEYGIVKCKKEEFVNIDNKDYLKVRKYRYDYELLVKNKKEFKRKYKMELIEKISLEELMVLMLKGE